MVKLNRKIKKDLVNLAKNYGIEEDLVDIEAMWDTSLTYQENRGIFERFFKTFSPDKERIIEEKIQEDEIEALQKKQFEEEQLRAKVELDKSINQIQNSTNSNIENYFMILNEYVDTLIHSETIKGLIIEGDTALGKSYNTIKRLIFNKLELDKDWVLLNTHISPMEMYQFFWKYQDKIIVLDDISNMFEDELKVNILMSSLWSAIGKRIINWISSTTKLSAPTSFEFKGKIILLTNRIPEHLATLKSRCFHYELNFSYEDKIRIIYEIGKLQNIPLEVLDFIKLNTNPANFLNFRTIFKINEIHKTNLNDGWKEIAIMELRGEPERQIVWDLINSGKKVNEQVGDFLEMTGKSRATYFRYKKEMSKSIAFSDIKK